MHFDDRLATVLRQRAAGERAARTQYRQLLDLLDERQDGMVDALEESGWERLSNLSAQIPARERAAILREGGWRLRNPALILFLAEQEPDVAASALSAVDLAPEDWVLLIPDKERPLFHVIVETDNHEHSAGLAREYEMLVREWKEDRTRKAVEV